jgi:hypothetical protein
LLSLLKSMVGLFACPDLSAGRSLALRSCGSFTRRLLAALAAQTWLEMIALVAFHLFAGATVLWADLSMENLLTGYIGTT